MIFYTHALAGGGAERVWALLASGFARTGREVVVAVDYECDANSGFIDPAVRMKVLGGGHAANVSRLKALIDSEAPDAVLSALSISNLKAAAAAAGAGALDRLILSYHGFAGAEPQKLSRLSYRLTPILTRMAAATVAVSDGLREELIETWRGDRRRITRIYNPVDSGPTRCISRADLAAREPAVLAVGRLERHKNFDAILRAFANVRPSEATLAILGDGPERSRLGALAERLGLSGRVRFLGYQKEPWRFYSRSKVLALASSSEAFGLVAVEAMAHGLAVVSTDCGGPREILADGQYGNLVPIGDEAAMTSALSAALAEPGDPVPRIARAQDYSLSRAIRDYGELIERVVAQRASHHRRAGRG